MSPAAMAARLVRGGPAPLDPITIREWLWGEGFQIPGTAEHVLALAEPLAARPGMRLVEMAAGLGGAARAIAAATGAHVSALERDPDLARHGHEMSIAAGMQRQAPVSLVDPETFELRKGAFDGVIGREATHMVEGKERFLRVLVQGLKPRGGLVLCEFVVEEGRAHRRELASWAALQPHPPSVWTLRQYRDCFLSLGVELRAREDVTASYKGAIVEAWERLLRTMNLRSLPRPHRLGVAAEAERWGRTIAALDSGALRMHRFHAVAGAGRPVPRAVG